MYSTRDLVAAMKRNISLSTSNIRFTTDDYIALLNEEIRWFIPNVLKGFNQGYFVEFSDLLPLTASTDTYDVPEFSSSWGFERLWYVDSSSNRFELYQRTFGRDGLAPSSDRPYGFMFEDSKVRVYPEVSTSPTGFLQYEYARILNLLKDDGEVGVISNVVDTGTDYVVTVDAVPTGYQNKVDFITSKNPYAIIAKDKTVSTVAGLNITVSKIGFDRAPIVGDTVAERGYTKYPHLPSEWHPLLAMAGSVRLLRAIGDNTNLPKAEENLGTMLEMMGVASKNRANLKPKKIVSRNYLLNMSRYRGR